MKVMIFLLCNAVFAVLVGVLWVAPTWREVSAMQNHTARLEVAIDAGQQLAANYADLLHEIELLAKNRSFVSYHEMADVLSYINGLATANNLAELSFHAGEPVMVDRYGLDIITLSIRLQNEGSAADILGFLYDLERTPVMAVTANMEWLDNSRVRLFAELLLVSYLEVEPW